MVTVVSLRCLSGPRPWNWVPKYRERISLVSLEEVSMPGEPMLHPNLINFEVISIVNVIAHFILV